MSPECANFLGIDGFKASVDENGMCSVLVYMKSKTRKGTLVNKIGLWNKSPAKNMDIILEDPGDGVMVHVADGKFTSLFWKDDVIVKSIVAGLEGKTREFVSWGKEVGVLDRKWLASLAGRVDDVGAVGGAGVDDGVNDGQREDLQAEDDGGAGGVEDREDAPGGGGGVVVEELAVQNGVNRERAQHFEHMSFALRGHMGAAQRQANAPTRKRNQELEKDNEWLKGQLSDAVQGEVIPMLRDIQSRLPEAPSGH